MHSSLYKVASAYFKLLNSIIKVLNMKEIFLKTEDNVKIAINHYDAGRDEIVIIAHGCYMSKNSYVFKTMAKDFFVNYDVIVMDFRGHGKSSGLFTFTARESNDLKAVVNFAKSKYSKINLLGFSLGAATSIIHTAKRKDINSLIVVSAPSSFEKIENHFFRKEAFFPTLQKFELWRIMSFRPGNPFLKKIKPVDVVQDISPIPILFLTGEKDPTIYPWHAQELYNKAKESKSIMIFKNNFHAEDLYLQSHDKFMSVCNEWFDKLRENLR